MPTRFAKTVAKLNKEQRQSIHEIGLGGLLQIHCISMSMQLIEELAIRFQPSTCKIRVHGKVIPFFQSEVSRLLGLANSGREDLGPCSNEEEAALREMYNLPSGEIKLRDIEANLPNIAGEEFKAKFLLYAIVTILNPPKGLRVSPRHLTLVRDMVESSTFNWAKFTFHGLLEGITSFQKCKTGNCTNKAITGCVLLLQVCGAA